MAERSVHCPGTNPSSVVLTVMVAACRLPAASAPQIVTDRVDRACAASRLWVYLKVLCDDTQSLLGNDGTRPGICAITAWTTLRILSDSRLNVLPGC
jgi:hypothetical protein